MNNITIKYATYMRRLYIPALCLVFLSACKQENYLLFSDIARIQFDTYSDTLRRHTFYYDDPSVTEDTVFFTIYAVGGIRNTDRSFALEQEQVPGLLNAEPGKHYVAFDDLRATRNYMIKAGVVSAQVPIILLRDASLRSTTPILKFRIKPNEDFQLAEINMTWRKVEFTDRLSQPTSWDAWMVANALGKYSVTKHAFMIETTDQRWDAEFITQLRSDEAIRKYYQNMLKTAQINYEKEHPGNPLRDETGELVVFP